MSSELLADERERLTLQARSSFGAAPPPFLAYTEDDTWFHVPRFYGLKRFGPAEHDDRVEGDPSDRLVFQGTLKDVQAKAMDAVHERNFQASQGAIVSLPCGWGKTIFAVALAARRGRRTVVLVHKAVIRDQWREKFEQFSPGARIGFVQGRTWEVEGYDVVVAMVMTLAKRDIDPSVFDGFGLVVVDEAHHMAAPVMNKAMRCFRARFVLGLTATKDRPDGLTPLLHWSLGPDGFHAERDSSEAVRVSVALYEGATREICTRAGRPLVALMLNQLATNHARNAFLAARIVALRRTGRVLMVLSDRLVQLATLRDMVVRAGIPPEDVGVFKGGLGDEERRVQLARPIVMCSYGMANEGVDKTEADTCVMATPKARVTQCIGRVQRPSTTKQSPLVLDVADVDAGVFTNLRRARQRLYDKQRYTVQVLPTTAAEDAWFT